MALPRAPGDIGPKTRSRSGTRKFFVNGVLKDTKNQSGVIERDLRPSFAYGAKTFQHGKLVWVSPTNYSHSSWKTSAESYTAIDSYKNGGNDWKYVDDSYNLGLLVGFTSPHYPGIPGDPRNEAVTKALNKIADQKINLGENLATFRQTLGMFTGRALKLSQMLHSGFRNKSLRPYFRKTARSINRDRSSANTAAGLYLEYVYGLKPLMDDVYTGYKLLQDAGIAPMYLSGEGSASRSAVLKPYTHSAQVIVRTGGLAGVKVKCKLYAELDPNTSALRTLNQFGLLNPLGLAWDLVPFSFVVDWFLPIGPVLYALTAPAGLKFRGGSISARTSQLNSFKLQASFVGQSNASRQAAHVDVIYEGFERQALTSWPLPGYWIVEDPFSGDRPLKAAALSIQALHGKARSW